MRLGFGLLGFELSAQLGHAIFGLAFFGLACLGCEALLLHQGGMLSSSGGGSFALGISLTIEAKRFLFDGTAPLFSRPSAFGHPEDFLTLSLFAFVPELPLVLRANRLGRLAYIFVLGSCFLESLLIFGVLVFLELLYLFAKFDALRNSKAADLPQQLP